MTYLSLEEFGEMKKFNQKFTTYGKCIEIKRGHILTVITVLCMLTPGTNWMIPLAVKFIKSSLYIRF